MPTKNISEIFKKYRLKTPDIRWPVSLRTKLRDFINENFFHDEAYSLYSSIDTYLFEEVPIATDLEWLEASDKIFLRQICGMRRYIARSGSLSAGDDKPKFSTEGRGLLT